jgi:hypothetical protein
MPRHTIQTFFKDGTYMSVGVCDPTCTLPNGSNVGGPLEISSTYQCEDTKQKFLQKNIKKNIEKGLILNSFNIYNDYYSMHNNGQAVSGKYKIKGNKLYIKFFGYSNTLGKICKQLSIYTLTSVGFIQKRYYLNNHGKYIVYINVIYTMIV